LAKANKMACVSPFFGYQTIIVGQVLDSKNSFTSIDPIPLNLTIKIVVNNIIIKNFTIT
jgi:hypothetical protein